LLLSIISFKSSLDQSSIVFAISLKARFSLAVMLSLTFFAKPKTKKRLVSAPEYDNCPKSSRLSAVFSSDPLLYYIAAQIGVNQARLGSLDRRAEVCVCDPIDLCKPQKRTTLKNSQQLPPKLRSYNTTPSVAK
jgi:hypothetical protein